MPRRKQVDDPSQTTVTLLMIEQFSVIRNDGVNEGTFPCLCEADASLLSRWDTFKEPNVWQDIVNKNWKSSLSQENIFGSFSPDTLRCDKYTYVVCVCVSLTPHCPPTYSLPHSLIQKIAYIPVILTLGSQVKDKETLNSIREWFIQSKQRCARTIRPCHA